MKCPRIQKAQVLSDTTLLVEFSDRTVKQYDIHRLLSIPMFSPLRQPAFFKSFRIAAGGYGIEWNEEIDISEHELWENGTPVGYQVINDDLNMASIAQDATD
jgi:hypothetical protein